MNTDKMKINTNRQREHKYAIYHHIKQELRIQDISEQKV
jgi:hypothetical protein